MTIVGSITILYCRRWNDTVDFYADGIGLKVLTRKEWFVEFRLSQEARLSVADERSTSVKSSAGLGITLSIHVDDTPAARLELLSRGLSPAELRTVWGSTAFFIRDPEGNRLEFWS